jgi:hypothetical protein
MRQDDQMSGGGGPAAGLDRLDEPDEVYERRVTELHEIEREAAGGPDRRGRFRTPAERSAAIDHPPRNGWSAQLVLERVSPSKISTLRTRRFATPNSISRFQRCR